MISITIPATTANIGPGFDCLGMALNLYNSIEIYEDVDKLTIEIDGVSSEIDSDENNLIYIAIKRLYSEVSKRVPPIRIVEKVNIPISRGLGSSAACIIGGLMAANVLLGSPFGKDRILDIANEMEGHPDNITPALLGGFVISAVTDSGIRYIRHSVDSNLKLIAMIPDFTLQTSKARSVLPQVVDYKDAVFNVGRSSLLTASLITGNLDNIRYAVEDKLHQPYRLNLIPDGEKLYTAAYENGADAFFISGSGSTLMAVVSQDEVLEKMKGFCKGLSTNWEVRTLQVDNCGIKVSKS